MHGLNKSCKMYEYRGKVFTFAEVFMHTSVIAQTYPILWHPFWFILYTLTNGRCPSNFRKVMNAPTPRCTLNHQTPPPPAALCDGGMKGKGLQRGKGCKEGLKYCV